MQKTLTKEQEQAFLNAALRAIQDNDMDEFTRLTKAHPELLDADLNSANAARIAEARHMREELENELIRALGDYDADKVIRLTDRRPGLLNMKFNKASLFAHIVNDAQEWVGDAEDNPDNAGSYNRLVRHLLEKNPPFHDAGGNTILHTLYLENATEDDFERARAKTGIDINSRNHAGETPLLRQIRTSTVFAKYLAEHPDVDITAQDNKGDNALHRAAHLHDADVVTKLVDKLSVNALNHADETPLGKIVAAHGNEDASDSAYPANQQIIRALMQRGGLVDMRDPAANVPIIKNMALGFAATSEEGVALFNKIVRELKHLETKISRRIPKEENSAEFRAFADVVAKANAFAKAFDPRHPEPVSLLLTDAVEHTDGSWQKVSETLKHFSEADCASAKDMVRGFAQSVVLPEIAQRTRNRANRVDYNKIVEELIPDIAPILIADRPLSTMLKLSRAWHARLPTLEGARSVRRTGSWEKAANDFTASNGYVVTFLDNAEKLRHEGDVMHHCVGGYAEKCKREGSHVASIRKIIKDGDGTYQVPVSTVEFSEHPDAAVPLQVKQHLGQHNAAPSRHAPESVALQEFLAKTKADYKGEDKITIDFSRIHKRRADIAREAGADDVKGLIGYDPFARTAPDKQDEYFKLYLDINTASGRTGSFIPGGNSKWAGKTAEDFLQETKIMDKVLNIAKEPPLLAVQGRAWP